MQCLCVNMIWIVYLVVTVLLNKSGAQDINKTVLVEAVAGYSAELPCYVTAEEEVEDDKLNILAWYYNGSSTAFYSRDLRGDADAKVLLPTGGRYRLVTSEAEGLDKLLIDTVNPSDAGVYQCLADFAKSPARKTFVELSVIEPPDVLWVTYANGTQVAKASAGVNTSQNIGYYVGDTVYLICVALGGRPKPSLSWWSDQRQLHDTSYYIPVKRVGCNIAYGPLRREDHGRVFSCIANNNDRSTELYIDVVVDMLLPPELVSLRAKGHDNGRVRAEQTLSIQCRVLGARPPPPVTWRLGDKLLNLEQNITMESSQRLLVSEVLLTMDREYDESNLTCCVPAYTRNDAELECAKELPLTILYRPALNIVMEEDLEDNKTLVTTKGSTVRMACSFQANPAVYQLIWFHEDDIITHDKAVQPFLELVDIMESDAGEYVCAASNDEGTAYSEPIYINVTYPPYCEEASIVEYGLGENDSINITCNVKGSPQPTSYRWVLVNDAVNITTMKNQPQTTVETEQNVLVFERINSTTYSTLFCWGINEVPEKGNVHTPCTFLVTDETMPRPPTNCKAIKNSAKDIIVKCEKGHNGGLPQKFKLIVAASDTDDIILSIINGEPEFMIPEPKQENYEFVIVAFNDKGDSQSVEIENTDVIDSKVPDTPASAVTNITTLALCLFGGVLLVALAACGLVLCSHDRGSGLDLRTHSDPPLCAYSTEDSNRETFHDSEDGSDFNVRRTESFRRAMNRYPSKNFDVRRTSSFHSARYGHDVEPDIKCNEMMRHGNSCRVHSMQNISRKRDMDALCDHLVLHLPPETNYNVPKQMNTFYTMPRKMRQKLAKEISDETSEITQTSDGFSLPPPPDEFGTYRAATRIKDIPTKSIPTYTTINKRNNSAVKEPSRQQYTQMAPMNTVGVPTISGAQSSLYTYPDEEHHAHQVTTNPFDDDST